MARLEDLVAYCDERLRRPEIPDFPGAWNGLQVQNNGKVTRIGASVDAGLVPFQMAAKAGVNFLIVHHGLYWDAPWAVVGRHHRKLQALWESNCAVYGAHLPLDCHPEIGNNAKLAQAIHCTPDRWFLPHEGVPIGLIADPCGDRASLTERLRKEFPRVTAMEFGNATPERIAILTGSGASAVDVLRKEGIDTLITGELRQHHFNLAQELELNLYCCGHYATETYGVQALAEELAVNFDLPWEFLSTDCPL